MGRNKKHRDSRGNRSHRKRGKATEPEISPFVGKGRHITQAQSLLPTHPHFLLSAHLIFSSYHLSQEDTQAALPRGKEHFTLNG